MPRNTAWIDAQRRLPWRVELPEPPGGLGHRLTELARWCGRRFPRERYFIYGGTFLFLEEADARDFAIEAGWSTTVAAKNT